MTIIFIALLKLFGQLLLLLLFGMKVKLLSQQKHTDIMESAICQM